MTKIHPTAIIGDHVTIGNSCQISEYVIIRDNVTIGNNVVIKPFAIIAGGTVSDNCFIGPKAMILRDDFDGNAKPCTIMQGVRVGAGAVILPGVFVASDTDIGAGAVVAKSITTSCGLYVGVPCHRVE